KLLQLPIHFFAFTFQLLRYTGKRPFQISRRQVKAPPVHIRTFVRETVRLRANNATVLDKPVKLGTGNSSRNRGLILPENSQICPVKGALRAIGKTNPVFV